MELIFFGNERLATGVSTDCRTLLSLIGSGYKVCAVVTNHSTAQSRNSRALEVAYVAKKHNIPLFIPSRVADIREDLRKFNAKIGVLVAYGKIIPKSIIDMFPYGIVNIHPSLLPLHRGPTPIESVILLGDRETGVSIMQLTQEMDAGPIYGQSRIRLNCKESKQKLSDTLIDIGSTMLTELLPEIISGSIVAIPQNKLSATYDQLIKKHDGKIDWTKPAEQLEKEIRAYAQWPKSSGVLENKEVIITEVDVVGKSGKPGTLDTSQNDSLVVFCGSNALKIKRLKPVGKNEISAQAFIAGYIRNVA